MQHFEVGDLVLLINASYNPDIVELCKKVPDTFSVPKVGSSKGQNFPPS